MDTGSLLPVKQSQLLPTPKGREHRPSLLVGRSSKEFSISNPSEHSTVPVLWALTLLCLPSRPADSVSPGGPLCPYYLPLGYCNPPKLIPLPTSIPFLLLSSIPRAVSFLCSSAQKPCMAPYFSLNNFQAPR